MCPATSLPRNALLEDSMGVNDSIRILHKVFEYPKIRRSEFAYVVLAETADALVIVSVFPGGNMYHLVI